MIGDFNKPTTGSPEIDEDQQSTYSTASSLTLSSATILPPSNTSIDISPSPSLMKPPNYNISNLNWGLTNNFMVHPIQIQTLSRDTSHLTFTINTLIHNLFTQLKIHNKNLSKNSIHISREMTKFINYYCIETFHTNTIDDMGLLFSYIKESIAMQINDKQIHIHYTTKGEIIIINIDLQFKDHTTMYLIGMLNEFKYIKTMPWKIVTIMRSDTIYTHFGITNDKLPKSSRNMRYFIDGLNTLPEYVSESIIWQTNFKTLCKKESKTKDKNNLNVVGISENDLKYYVQRSWNNGKCLPVVFITGKSQCIEKKQLVEIFPDENGNEQWIGISLRYYPSNKQWKITCIDYDGGRIYYQFRLVGNNHNYYCSYNELSKLVNTKLNIF